MWEPILQLFLRVSLSLYIYIFLLSLSLYLCLFLSFFTLSLSFYISLFLFPLSRSLSKLLSGSLSLSLSLSPSFSLPCLCIRSGNQEAFKPWLKKREGVDWPWKQCEWRERGVLAWQRRHRNTCARCWLFRFCLCGPKRRPLWPPSTQFKQGLATKQFKANANDEKMCPTYQLWPFSSAQENHPKMPIWDPQTEFPGICWIGLFLSFLYY